MYCFIFDIDGTLLNTNSAGKKAFKEAFESTYNVLIPEDFFGISFLGGVDLSIYKQLLQIMEIKKNKLNKFLDNYEYLLSNKYNKKKYNWIFSENLEEYFNNLKKNNFLLTVATGNFYKTAYIKLKEINILNFLDFIGACENETKREDILLKAINFAKLYNIESNNTFYIGDAISDQLAANSLNINFIGIGKNIDKNILKKNDFYFENIDFMFNNIFKILNFIK
jgi:phosphoglycolate phosphatase-like HAD superfamily hydrolase